MYQDIITFIQNTFQSDQFIPLHAPVFIGNEKAYLLECIDSTFVSSVGKFVDQFEDKFAEYTGAKFAIATVNGTAALHVALRLVGVEKNTEVITQALSFVATCNAISYCNAIPVFIDVDKSNMGLCPDALLHFLSTKTERRVDGQYNKQTGRKITAVLPMHTFGHPAGITQIKAICESYSIPLVEDAAESLGSYSQGKHTGTFGEVGAFSFNGNKTITTGGGGMIVTDDESLAKKAKHLTTTAKVASPYEYIHDMVGYNYRLPNLNAAIGCAQLEKIQLFLDNKRELAMRYKSFFENKSITFIEEEKDSKANYWLNAVLLADKIERDNFLDVTNKAGVMTRPIWQLMNKLDMYKSCQTETLTNSYWLEERIVNIPSSVRPKNHVL
jgi:perosamine synthetase